SWGIQTHETARAGPACARQIAAVINWTKNRAFRWHISGPPRRPSGLLGASGLDIGCRELAESPAQPVLEIRPRLESGFTVRAANPSRRVPAQPFSPVALMPSTRCF